MSRMNRNQKPEPKTPPKKPWSVPPKLQEAAKDTLARARVEAIISPNVPLDTFNLVTVSEAVQLLAQHRNREQLRMNAMGLPAAAAAEHADNFWRQSLPELADKHSADLSRVCRMGDALPHPAPGRSKTDDLPRANPTHGVQDGRAWPAPIRRAPRSGTARNSRRATHSFARPGQRGQPCRLTTPPPPQPSHRH